jgi:hypothetical protein
MKHYCRVSWVEQWLSIHRHAVESKESQAALEQLSRAYSELRPDERAVADEWMAENATSTNESRRYDAIALIREFRIVSASPSLRDLAASLEISTEPGAPFELRKVQATLEELE